MFTVPILFLLLVLLDIVARRYRAEWGGVSEGRPMAAGLDHLGEHIFEQLKAALTQLYPLEVRLKYTVLCNAALALL